MSDENQIMPNTLRSKGTSWLPSIGLLALLLALAAAKPAPSKPKAEPQVRCEQTSILTNR